jgi:hypothetical protein
MKKLKYALACSTMVFLFVATGALRAQTVTVAFQSDTLGQVLPHLGWSQADIQPVIADDPVNSGQGHHVLKNIVHNYGAAPVLQVVLPAGKTLADYNKFNFKGYFAQGDVGYKYIVVQAHQTMPTGNAFQDTVGIYNRAQMGSTAWENISIPINGSASLTDTIYLAFGINCAGKGTINVTAADSSTIWYADSIQLVPKPAPPVITMWTFQSDSLGDSLAHLGYSQADIQPVVAIDPLNPGHRVLKNSVHGYGAAPILMAILPAGKTLADYNKFNFKGYFAQGDVGYKGIVVQAHQTMPTGNAFTDTVGFYNRAQMGSTAWENISIPINGSSSLTDTVYISFGINCAGKGTINATAADSTTIWYADSIQLVPRPAPPASITMWTFQSDSLGDSLAHMGFSQADIHPVVAVDPVNPGSGHRVLENIVHNYGAAPILMAILPTGKTLADYNMFNFKGYFKQGDVGYKAIIVQAYSTMPTGAAFKSPNPDSIGAYNRAVATGSTAWENISIPINGSASMSDTVYLAFGINCAGTGSVGAAGDTTIWYADSIQLVAKAPPASPTLGTPAAAATGVPRRATFTWNASTNATQYRLQVATSSAFSSPVFDTTLAGTSVQLSTPLAATRTYYWRVSAINSVGQGAYSAAASFTTGTGIDAVDPLSGLPKEFALYQSYPNPFNPSTTIRYDLPKNAFVQVIVYDVLGRKVATLVDGMQQASRQSVVWNPGNMSSGVYFCRITARSVDGSGNFSAVKKLMFMK